MRDSIRLAGGRRSGGKFGESLKSLPVAPGTTQTGETLHYLLCGGWIEVEEGSPPARPFSARIRGKGGLESAWSAFQVRASNEFWHGN